MELYKEELIQAPNKSQPVREKSFWANARVISRFSKCFISKQNKNHERKATKESWQPIKNIIPNKLEHCSRYMMENNQNLMNWSLKKPFIFLIRMNFGGITMKQSQIRFQSAPSPVWCPLLPPRGPPGSFPRICVEPAPSIDGEEGDGASEGPQCPKTRPRGDWGAVGWL